MKKQPQYFNILTTEGSDEATILLYGYIGEAYAWDTEKNAPKEVGVTDIAFVQELERLAAKYNTIHVRINSPGGEIFHGSAIVTAIRNCKAEVNTWIDGVAASMAGVIWMAGEKRHMAKNGMLMIHSASGLCWGNAADMREMADTLDAFDQSLVTACADALGMSEQDMRKKYFDGKDHWLTYNDVSAEGWLSAAADDDYEAEDKLPEDIAKMSYRDLVAYFEKEKHPQAEQGFLQKVRAFFEETAALFGGNHSTTSSAAVSTEADKNTLDMNLEDFKKSIEAKTLDIKAVKAFLAEQDAPPATPADDNDSEAVAELRKDLDAALAANANLAEQFKTLSAQIAEWGKQPGASKSAPGMPENDLPTDDTANTIESRMKKAAEFYNNAAVNNEQAQFVIGN